MQTVFYTYLYLREDGTPWYVGKGTWKRIFSSRHRVPPPPKDRILAEPHTSEDDAFEAEKFLISYYGRKDIGTGCLWNLTDGGEGMSGHVLSEETRAKLLGNKSRTGQTWKQTPDWTAKIVAASKGKPRPLSIGNKSRTGMKNSEEWIRKARARMTGKSMPHKGKPWSAARRAAHNAKIGKEK